MRKDLGSKPVIYPLPVLIIGTYDENDVPDAMNAAWGGMYDSDQIVLCLSASHKTTKNIMINKAFTVSFANKDNLVASDYVGIVSGNKEQDKIKKAGWTTTKSTFVNAPIIDQLPVVLECEYLKVTEDGNIVGKIVNVSVDEDYLTDDDHLLLEKFSPLAYDPINHTYIECNKPIGKAFSDGKQLI